MKNKKEVNDIETYLLIDKRRYDIIPTKAFMKDICERIIKLEKKFAKDIKGVENDK